MRKFIIRLAINAVALYAAVNIVDGIKLQDNSWLAILGLALIFGLVNAIIKPLLKVLSCPVIILTMGLGTLLINTLMFALAGWIGTNFNIGFVFTGDWFVPSFLAALIISVVSFILNLLLKEEMK